MKKRKEHIGDKIKRLRAYRGMTQEDLATSIGKTRSLISYFERTGIINKYTLREIASILQASPDEFDLDQSDVSISPQAIREPIVSMNDHIYEKLINQQQTEILFLKETINHQWQLLKGEDRK